MAKKKIETRRQARGFLRKKFSKYSSRYIEKVPKTTRKQNELAHEMIAWIIENDKTHLQGFAIEKRIPLREIKAIGDFNTYFKRALEICKDIISARLQDKFEEGAFKFDYIRALLPLYNDEFKRFMMSKWMKAEESHRNEVTVVEIPDWRYHDRPSSAMASS